MNKAEQAKAAADFVNAIKTIAEMREFAEMEVE